jgi:hypothetical protein
VAICGFNGTGVMINNMKKKVLFLTDITLHIRGFKPTCNFRKAEENRRFYTDANFTPVTSVPEEKTIKELAIDNVVDNNKEKETITLTQALPQEVVEGMRKGEIILMVPKDGLPLIAGDDLWEYMEKIEKSRLNQSKHRGGVWRSDK